MRTVLITGAGRGFGRALFDLFSGRGWCTFPLVRDPRAAAALGSAAAGPCYPILGSVASEQTAGEIARVLGERTGSLDLLINNAGNVVKTEGILNMTAGELEEHFRVHCVGAFLCTRAAFPFLLKAERPIVVNVTSRRGSASLSAGAPSDRAHAYKIAKCAQNMLTICLDQELSRHGIRVMAVHPGSLQTQVAPPDADTPPAEAAARLADWIESIDRDAPRACYDLIGGATIPW